MAQIASFYAGAMTEAREIELAPIVGPGRRRRRTCSSAPTTPRGCCGHTQECRDRGYPFLADPCQQLAFGDGEMIRDLIDGAEILFSNEYESALIDAEDRLERRRGARRASAPGSSRSAPRASGSSGRARSRSRSRRCRRSRRSSRPASATPSGPASSPRSSGGCRLERAAQLGCLLAVYVVERVGTQEYTLHQRRVRRPVRRGVRRRGGGRDRARTCVTHAAPDRARGVSPRRRTSVGAARRRAAASSPTYSWPRIRHHAGDVRARAPGRRPSTATIPPTATSPMRVGQPDDRQRAAQPAAVQLEVGRVHGPVTPALGPAARHDHGRQHRRAARRRPPSVVVAGERDPDVAVRERPHRGEHVRGLERCWPCTPSR